MTYSMHDQIEQAAAELRAQGERIMGFQEDLARRSTTVVSKDRLVEATVNGAGRLTALAIKGNRYRMMSPAELSNVVLETVNAALEKASAETMAAAKALMPSAFSGGGMDAEGSIDLEELMKEAMQKINDPALRFHGGPGGGL
jgi:DNA-binding protein YbaB